MRFIGITGGVGAGKSEESGIPGEEAGYPRDACG